MLLCVGLLLPSDIEYYASFEVTDCFFIHSMGYLCVCIRKTMFANLQVSVKLAYLDGYRLQ